MNPELFQDDCSHCAALCCVALAFDKSHLFAFDKSAGKPCSHLKQDTRCGIHDKRATSGFTGCIRYSCFGAGQRVVQECFDGKTWQSNATLTKPMMHAFQQARRIHELLLFLVEAHKLPLRREQHTQANELTMFLTPEGAMTESWLATVSNSKIEMQVYQFLGTLKPLASKHLILLEQS